MLKRSSSFLVIVSSSPSSVRLGGGGLFTPSRTFLARKEDEERAKTWKLPSFLTKFLDQTAPAHLRGTYMAEEKEMKHREEQLEKQKHDDEVKKSKRKSAATQAAKVSFSSEERGFVKSTSSTSSSSSNSSNSSSSSSSAAGNSNNNNNNINKKQMASQDKYGVNWSNEETAAEDRSSSSSSSAGDAATASASRFGSNLPHSKQFVDDDEAAATDVLAGTHLSGGQAGDLGKGGKAKEKGPSLFTRAWSTFKMTREDASAIRDEDAEQESKGLREDEVQTGKYFKKLHQTSLKSWTKQCFQRLPEVEESCKLISVEVETSPDTDIVTVFVTADGLDDKKLASVKRWVEAVCPVTKARDKLIQRMEDEERKRQSQLMASPTAVAGVGSSTNRNIRNRQAAANTDPMKQFAKRRNIRWIRIDAEQ